MVSSVKALVPKRELAARARKKIMTSSGKIEKPLTVGFIDAGARVLLELTNTSDEVLKGVEVLAVFLNDEETPGGGPSRAHIKFEAIRSLQPKEKAVLSHRTWIDGKPVATERDQLARLTVRAGEAKPYVLDISWEDGEGKSRYQRIPIGH